MRLISGLKVWVLVICMANPTLYALPENPQIVSGEASFELVNELTLNITASNNSIIQYSAFNIAPNETVQFFLPSIDSYSLNRVLGNSASSIFGSLIANGNIILVNANGIHFGSSAQVNVGGLIASTLDISDQSFLNGHYLFGSTDEAIRQFSQIINEGNIFTQPGGYAVLAGSAVENKGVISAPLGSVALVSGDMVTVGISEDGLISVGIDLPLSQTIYDINGDPLTSQIVNLGTLQADGGRVLLSAKTLNDVISTLIKTDGMVQAVTAVERDGVVEFTANGIVETFGNISATHLHIGEAATINGNNAYFQVEGNWLNAGSFHGQDSTVEFVSSKISLISGDNQFHNFTVRVPGKVMEFEAGSHQTISGNWEIEGAYGQHVRLLSSDSEALWYVNPSGQRIISYAWVEDSYNVHPDEIIMIESTNRDASFGWDPTGTWINVGGDGLWSNAANWSGLGGATPGAGDDVLFNATSPTNSSVDVGFGGSIRSFTSAVGYTGTITLNRSLTLTGSGVNGDLLLASGTLDLNGNTLTVPRDFNQTGGTLQATGGGTLNIGRDFSQSAGTATAGTTFDVERNFAVSAGTFNAGSANLFVTNNFTISGTGVFNEGTSTVILDGGGATIDVLTTETFNNLTINSTGNKTVAANDTLIVNGTLNLTDGSLNQGTIPAAGTIAARGNIVQESTFDGGTGHLIIDGSGNQLFTGNATTTAGDIPDLTINKSGGTLTLAGTVRLDGNGAGAWTYIAGTVDATTNNSLVVFNAANTIDGQGASSTMAFDNVEFRGGTATLAGALDVDGDLNIISGATLNTSGSNHPINIAGNWTNAGTFTSNTSIVTFDGSSDATLITGGTGAGQDFHNLVIAKTGGAKVELSANGLDVDNSLTISFGILSLNGQNISTITTLSNDGTLRLQGGESVSFTSNDTDSGTWEYVGNNNGVANTFTIKDFGGTDYFNLVINSADAGINADAFQSDAAKSITGTLAVSSGSYNANGNTTTVTGLTTVSGGAYQASTTTQTFNGGLSVSGGTFTGSAGAVDVNGNLSLSSGVLTAPSGAFTVSGDWNISGGTFTPGTNTVTLDGGTAQSLTPGGSNFYNLTHSGAGTVTLLGALAATNSLTNSAGSWISGANTIDIDGNFNNSATFTAPSTTLNVAGGWTNSGTFNHNSGTVILDGGDQSISGSTTFNNLTKVDTTNNSTDVTLTFDNTGTQTVDGLLTFSGLDADDRVNLVSDSPGNQWSLTANGTFAIDFVDVQDSDASGGLTIVHTNTVNSGNNANWNFAERFTITGTAVMTAGDFNELTITATDNYGFTATSYSGLKSLTFSGLANALEGSSVPQVEGVNFGTGTSINFTSGISDANAATLQAFRAESASVDVTDGSISSTAATNLDLIVNPAAANHLKITGTSVMTAGDTNELSITAHDLYGNTATAYAGLKSLTFSGLANSPDGSIPTVEGINFGSATNVNFTSGVSDANSATLQAFNAEAASVDVTDGAIDSSFDAAHDLDLTVNPGAANNFNFLQQPSNAIANEIITPAIALEIRDQFNNVRVNDNVTIASISINSNPGGSTLAGTLNQTAVNGIVTFDDISLSSGGVGYTLDIDALGMATATSNLFNIISPTVITVPTGFSLGQSVETLGTNILWSFVWPFEEDLNVPSVGYILNFVLVSLHPVDGMMTYLCEGQNEFVTCAIQAKDLPKQNI